MNKRSITISIFIILVIGLVVYLFVIPKPAGPDLPKDGNIDDDDPSITPQAGIAVRLYYYDPAKDQGPGGVQCSENGLVAVERVIPQTARPLTETIKLLLQGDISSGEKTRGVTSEFPLAGVSLTSASIQDGVATLTFSDPQNKTGGGSCRVAILWMQIEATARQFETVKSVRFMPEELFQP